MSKDKKAFTQENFEYYADLAKSLFLLAAKTKATPRPLPVMVAKTIFASKAAANFITAAKKEKVMLELVPVFESVVKEAKAAIEHARATRREVMFN